jgi:ectoine hydroxylase-related dioxygenase (phytanoyl-CoA dioxygenase family)
MNIKANDVKYYKKKGYLIKNNLIPIKEINKINKLIYKIITVEKNKKIKINDHGGSQTFNNSHFVYNNNSSKNKEILRLNNPQNNHKLFFNLSRNKKIISIVKKLIGGSVRFHLGKLNFKLPNKKKGSEIEWHQDWAFYPHTNDDLVTVGIYLEDCDEKNGPLKVISGSHKLSLLSHHGKDRYFNGKINTKKNKININKSVSLTGSAGSVVFFHCRTIHASGLNHANSNRPLILFGYRACDAWPIIDDGNPHHDTNFDNYEKNIIVGKKSLVPRCKNIPIIIPLPKKKHFVSIYQLQKNK